MDRTRRLALPRLPPRAGRRPRGSSALLRCFALCRCTLTGMNCSMAADAASRAGTDRAGETTTTVTRSRSLGTFDGYTPWGNVRLVHVPQGVYPLAVIADEELLRKDRSWSATKKASHWYSTGYAALGVSSPG